MKTYQKCPKCGGTTNILIEKRPNGDSQCVSCGFKEKSSLFEVKYIPEKVLVLSGKYYITADGLIVKITAHYGAGDKTIFVGSNKAEYNYIGHDIRDNKDNDLIAEINEQLHFEILRIVNEYHNNKIFKHFIDKSYKDSKNEI